MSDAARRLLGGHATDTLNEMERRELLRAALEDQEVFDRLLEEEGLRELLSTPGARERLVDALGRPGLRERARAWLTRPATVGDLAGVAAAIALALGAAALHRASPAPPAPAAAARSAPATPLSHGAIGALAGLAARQALPATIQGDPGPGVRPGEALRVRLAVGATSRVALLDVGPDGAAVQVWPPAGSPPALLAPASPDGRAVRVVPGPGPGPRRLRLVAFPPDIDLGAVAPARIGALAPLLTLADLPYEVHTP